MSLIDVIEYGKWEHLEHDKYRCTACKRDCHVETVMGKPDYERCPHCGAIMNGEQIQPKLKQTNIEY